MFNQFNRNNMKLNEINEFYNKLDLYGKEHMMRLMVKDLIVFNPDTRSLDSVTDQVAINGSAVQIRVYADGEARYDESL